MSNIYPSILCPRDGITKRDRERERYIFSIQWQKEKSRGSIWVACRILSLGVY